VWQWVESEGCVADLGGAELANRLTDVLGFPIKKIDRVVGIPIKIQEQTVAVFLAGLRHSEDSSETRARLAQYAMLVALSLERENQIAETAKWTDSCLRVIESSADCLLEMDGAGYV